MILGLRPATRLRYGDTPYVAGVAQAAPLLASDAIQVSDEPVSRRRLDDLGLSGERGVALVTYAELRGAVDGVHRADRVLLDGTTYEVVDVDPLLPFEGSPRAHYEAVCIAVQPLRATGAA